jgi:hypothetical protein
MLCRKGFISIRKLKAAGTRVPEMYRGKAIFFCNLSARRRSGYTKQFWFFTVEYKMRRKLHNDELHSLYSSPNIGRVIKSRRMTWHAWENGEVFTGFWLGSPKVKDHWEDLGVGGRITLSWTLER